MSALPAGVQVAALRKEHRNTPASPGIVVAENDVVLVVGPNREVLAAGRPRPWARPRMAAFVKDRSDLDYVRMFASRPAVVGRALGDLELPGAKGSVVIQIRRGDAEMLPRPDLVLEFGDRIGMLANRGDFATLRKYFGDSIKGTAEFSYISIGLGMALGFYGRCDPVPAPRHRQDRGRVVRRADRCADPRQPAAHGWHELDDPLSANLVLRNLGLTLFLAQVGMSSGPKFAATVAETGPDNARA
jgi:putative transport protein